MGIALRYHRDRDEAASSVNLAFLKILNNISKYDPSQSFGGWTRQIVIRTIIDEYRKEKRFRDQIMSHDHDSGILLNGNHVEHNHAEINLSVETLTGYLYQLQPMTSSVFNLFVIDGYSHKDIGDMLDISEAASKWHLFTARKQLQEIILKENKPYQPTSVPSKIETV